MIKKIYQLIIVTVLVLGFSACNDDGSDSSFSASTSDSTTVIGCSETTNIPDGYTTLGSGDTIVKDSDNTEISIYHDSDGNKKICVSSGSASIIKG